VPHIDKGMCRTLEWARHGHVWARLPQHMWRDLQVMWAGRRSLRRESSLHARHHRQPALWC
jgi:hypothetical protein